MNSKSQFSPGQRVWLKSGEASFAVDIVAYDAARGNYWLWYPEAMSYTSKPAGRRQRLRLCLYLDRRP